MDFIEFCDEIINVNCIEMIYKRNLGPEYARPYEICIGEFKSRDILIGTPTSIIVNEGYESKAQRDFRFDQLMGLLCRTVREQKKRKAA